MKHLIALAVFFATLLPVIAPAATKKLEHRAWLGGEFKQAKRGGDAYSATRVGAFPRDLKQRAGVFVSAVHPETPLATASLAAGDLILALDGKPVTSPKALERAVESRAPGDTVRLSVYRDGEIEERTATLGIESYEHWRTLSVGLMLTSKIDLVPNPEFSALALGFKRKNERIDLRSPEVEFFRRHRRGSRGERGVPGRESWQAWCVLFSLGGHKQIVSQEPFAAGTSPRASLR